MQALPGGEGMTGQSLTTTSGNRPAELAGWSRLLASSSHNFYLLLTYGELASERACCFASDL